MRTRATTIGAAVVVAAAVAWGAVALTSSPDYTVKVRLASATNLVDGGTVQLNGFPAGSIEGLDVDNGQAVVTLGLDSDHAPLHDGAKVNITWKALLGERIVQITDGTSKTTIPDNGMIAGTQKAPVELDTILNALDAPTRTKLSALIKQLDTTTAGSDNQQNLNATLKTAGPALNALGGTLRALGTDGPAIKNLVTRLNTLTTTLAKRNTAISTMVDEVNRLTTLTAAQKKNLSAAIKELPSTLTTANSTLAKVPGTVRNAVPLLNALQPATAKLPTVAKHLSPVLQSLRPAAAKLRPTLEAASQLLQYTPGLLDSGASTVSQLQTTINYLQPMLSFLRPYTPETVGFLTEWASAFSDYDTNGHYARIFVQGGGSSFDANPGIPIPGVSNTPYPLPGQNAGQPWTDAFGSGPR